MRAEYTGEATLWFTRIVEKVQNDLGAAFRAHATPGLLKPVVSRTQRIVEHECLECGVRNRSRPQQTGLRRWRYLHGEAVAVVDA